MVIEGPWKRPRSGKPQFSLGELVATPNALRSVPQEELLAAVARHHGGDWGEIDPLDKKANDAALIHGGRLFSAYKVRDGTRFWIITEADYSVTTVLLPDDY